MTGKYKKLLTNSAVFAIGNLGSKFISFFLLPLYTYTLTTNQYGTVDLIQTTVNLLLPVISLNVFEGVLRFAMDKNESPTQILRVGLQFTVIGSIFAIIVALVCQLFSIRYAIILVLILIVQAFQSLFSQYIKAIGKVNLYAVNGIILTFVTAIFDVIMLVVFKMGIFGYLFAIFLATLISDVFMVRKAKFNLSVIPKKSDRQVGKRLMRYSAPLIPNSIAWWTTSTVSRYFIAFFVGTAANGIFAVSNRIPALLNVINSVFFQSWQLSAIEEYDSKDKKSFYSNVFNMYSMIMFLCTSLILCILKPLMKLIVSPAYFVSWKYIPLLLVSVVFSSFSSFFGQYYIAAKKTNGVFFTTIIGAIINVLLNWLLIPRYGLYGAAVSSLISYFILWGLRVIDTRKIIDSKLNYKNMFINIAIITFQVFCLYKTGIGFVVLIILSSLVSLINNRQIISVMYRSIHH